MSTVLENSSFPAADLKAEDEQAIAACKGDARAPVKALLVACDFLVVLAFSRTGDPSTGDFGHAKAIRKFGDVPDDLSAP